MIDNRQFFFDLIDCCCAESGVHIEHMDKLSLIHDLIEISSKKPDIEDIKLKRYIQNHIGGNRFHQIEKIGHSIGISWNRKNKT